MRIRFRGTGTVGFATLAATLAATATADVGFAPSASADTRAAAATNGRVCMFDAPKGALSLGHLALGTVHARRRDLKVLRALGADTRWITSRSTHRPRAMVAR